MKRATTGRELSEKWKIDARQTLYRKSGNWFHLLRECSSIRLERGVGQSHGAQQDRSIRQMASNCGVRSVHGVATGDYRDHASGPDHVKGLGQKVIVYGAGQVRASAVRRIVDRIVAE
jgi:hypothetical protein